MPDEEAKEGPLTGDVKIGKTKIPKWLILVAAGGGVLALYLGTRGPAAISSEIGGGVAQPNGESTTGTAGAATLDSTALIDAVNQGFKNQNQNFTDLARSMQNQQQVVAPPVMYTDSYPVTDTGGVYSQLAAPQWDVPIENTPDLVSTVPWKESATAEAAKKTGTLTKTVAAPAPAAKEVPKVATKQVTAAVNEKIQVAAKTTPETAKKTGVVTKAVAAPPAQEAPRSTTKAAPTKAMTVIHGKR